MKGSKPKNPGIVKGWYIVLISALAGCSLSSAFPQYSMTVESLSSASGLPAQLLLKADTVKSLAIVLAMACAGPIFQRVRLHVIFGACFLCNIIPQLLLPSITTPAALMALKVIQGAGALIFPVIVLVLVRIVEPSQSGFASAVFIGVFNCGGGIGGILAGFLTPRYGWVSSYYVLAAIQAATGLIWLFTVRCPDFRRDMDAGSKAAPSAARPWRVFASPQVWLLIFAFLSTTYVLQAVSVDMPLYSMWLGYDQAAAGKLSTAVLAGTLAACLLSGKVSDAAAARTPRKAKARLGILTLGPVMMVVCSLFITARAPDFRVFYISVCLLAFGASWGLGSFYSILPELYRGKELAAITGFIGGVGDLGMPLAPFLVGVTFGSQGLWGLGWATCTGISAVSIAACAALFWCWRTR